MAGTVKTNIQLGDSITATQNFTLTAAAQDGTMKLARGNFTGTTQDIMTVDASGYVAMPASLATCMVYNTANVIIAGNTTSRANLSTKEFDTTSSYNTTLNRYVPPVNGYYRVDANLVFSTPGGAFGYRMLLVKNATLPAMRDTYSTTSSVNPMAMNLSTVVYLTTSDYVELWVWPTVPGGSIPVMVGSSTPTSHMAITLIQRA